MPALSSSRRCDGEGKDSYGPSQLFRLKPILRRQKRHIWMKIYDLSNTALNLSGPLKGEVPGGVQGEKRAIESTQIPLSPNDSLPPTPIFLLPRS